MGACDGWEAGACEGRLPKNTPDPEKSEGCSG